MKRMSIGGAAAFTVTKPHIVESLPIIRLLISAGNLRNPRNLRLKNNREH